MPQALTTLQQNLLDSLDVLGLKELAAHAHSAWSEFRAYAGALTAAEVAAMEGALLSHDFRLANRQARAAMSRGG